MVLVYTTNINLMNALSNKYKLIKLAVGFI